MLIFIGLSKVVLNWNYFSPNAENVPDVGVL